MRLPGKSIPSSANLRKFVVIDKFSANVFDAGAVFRLHCHAPTSMALRNSGHKFFLRPSARSQNTVGYKVLCLTSLPHEAQRLALPKTRRSAWPESVAVGSAEAGSLRSMAARLLRDVLLPSLDVELAGSGLRDAATQDVVERSGIF